MDPLVVEKSEDLYYTYYSHYKHKSMPRCVFIGNVGTGKTTILNKLAGTNQNVRQGGSSVTHEIYPREARYSRIFFIIDTPGLGAESNKLHSVNSIYLALTYQPVNRIIVFAKYDRIGIIKESIEKILIPLEQYIN